MKIAEPACEGNHHITQRTNSRTGTCYARSSGSCNQQIKEHANEKFHCFVLTIVSELV